MRSRQAGRVLPRAGTALAAASALLVIVALPHASGTTWTGVRRSVRDVPLAGLMLSASVWAAGLWCYSYVLTGSLPRLSRRRALLLNLSGSAAACAVPLGGALGVWLNTRMLRSWGFRPRQIADFTVVSNIADVGGKLLLAGALVTVATCLGAPPPVAPDVLLAAAVTSLVALLLAFTVCIRTGVRLSLAAASRVLSGFPVLRRLSGPGRTAFAQPAVAWSRHLLDLRGRVGLGLRAGWLPLTVGSMSYVGSQALLFVLCVHLTATGVGPPELLDVLLAFAVDRLASLVPLTPAGAGLAEAGASAVLIASGADPASAVAGVFLYRIFVVVAEVPVGALVLGGWLLRSRWGPTSPQRRAPRRLQRRSRNGALDGGGS